MKIRRTLSSKWFRFGVPVLMLLVLLAVRQREQRPLFCDYAMDPTSGKYSPDLAAWILPITTTDGDKTSIDLGNRLSVADSIQQDVLCVLSPTLRMHPQTKVFVVKWNMLCCTDGGTSDGGQNLSYWRDSGEVTYHAQGYRMGKAYNTTKVVAQGVDDLQIHRLAALNRPYSELGK